MASVQGEQLGCYLFCGPCNQWGLTTLLHAIDIILNTDQGRLFFRFRYFKHHGPHTTKGLTLKKGDCGRDQRSASTAIHGHRYLWGNQHYSGVVFLSVLL